MNSVANKQNFGNTLSSNKQTIPIPEYAEQQEAEDTLKTDSSIARSGKNRESANSIYADANPAKGKSRRNISAMNIIDAQSSDELSVQD